MNSKNVTHFLRKKQKQAVKKHQVNGRFNRYTSAWKFSLKFIKGEKNKRLWENQLDTYRLLYNRLLKCCDLLNETFKYHLLILSCNYFAVLLLLLHRPFSSEYIFVRINVFLSILYCLYIIYSINVCSDHLTCSSELLLDELTVLPTAKLSTNTKLQIEIWLLQFKGAPVSVSAASYFKLNKSTFSSALMMLATYSVLINQLEDDILKKFGIN
ncbi:uncharacterized protein LOC142328326 [Lycorma delicatula]|uniref:uncharacterized protein LOC142328326 n=1 Tax=Lycorma delicatula TaxID=130591 RepID=UPI003F51104A